MLGLIEHRSECWDPARWKEDYTLGLPCGFMWPGFGLVLYAATLTSIFFLKDNSTYCLDDGEITSVSCHGVEKEPLQFMW